MWTSMRVAVAACGMAVSVCVAQEGGRGAPTEPGAWVIVPQGRTPVVHHRPGVRPAVSLSRVGAEVAIDDQAASTTLVLTITNTTGAQQEARVLLPVPEGATVRSFALDGLGEEATAKILPRDEARRIYDAIVSASKDPGLLEFVGLNVLKSSVFPVPANGSQTVRLTYETLLPADTTTGGTRLDYALPRTEALQASGAEWTFAAEIRSRRKIASVYSPSHEIDAQRIGAGHFKVKLKSSAGAGGTLRLATLLEPEDGDGLAATVLMYPDPEIGSGRGGYFLMLASFPAGEDRRDGALKREVTVVLDRSGSMGGEKMEQAREGALQVLEGLKPGEYFNIIDYSDSIQSLSSKPLKKDEETMAKARRYLAEIGASGGTNIHDALVEALSQQPTAGALPVVMFLTDGLPTVGKTRETDIREAAERVNAHGRRIFSFGVGLDVNSPLLSHLADASRGAPTFVLPGEDVEVKVSQVFRRLSGPVLAMPAMVEKKDDDGPGRLVREMLPRRLPDVFEGEQLIVLGQYTGAEPVTMLLSGNYLGQDRTFEVRLDPSTASTKNAFVPRIWATRKVADLVDAVRQSGADGKSEQNKELVEEIVRLSTRWGILTEYTAFLVQEPPATQAAARERMAQPARPMAPAASAPAEAEEYFRARTAVRTGAAGVNQEMNVAKQKGVSYSSAGGYFDAQMNEVRSQGMQQVADRTFLWRANRWVDSRLLNDEAKEPEQIIELGTEEHRKLVDDLTRQNLQGVLSMIGDVYLVQDGRRVLIRTPG